MAEDTTVQQDESGAPAETPALDSEAIRQMVEAEAQRIVDARIPGLQSAYEKQLAQLRKQLETRGSEGGDTYDYGDEMQKKLEQAQREAAVLRAGRQYPDVFPMYEAIMAANDFDEQMELLRGFLNPKQEQQTQQAPPQAPAAPPKAVDQNNPPSSPPPPVDGPSDEDSAYRIIDAVGARWPEFR